MDFEHLVSWLTKNKDWLLPLFGGSGVVVLAWLFGVFRWIFGLFGEKLAPAPTVDFNGMAGRLVETSTQLGAAQEREQSYQTELREKDEEIKALRNAIAALEEQRSVPDAPPGVDDALEQLSGGETDAAEALFEEILERKKVEGEP